MAVETPGFDGVYKISGHPLYHLVAKMVIATQAVPSNKLTFQLFSSSFTTAVSVLQDVPACPLQVLHPCVSCTSASPNDYHHKCEVHHELVYEISQGSRTAVSALSRHEESKYIHEPVLLLYLFLVMLESIWLIFQQPLLMLTIRITTAAGCLMMGRASSTRRTPSSNVRAVIPTLKQICMHLPRILAVFPLYVEPSSLTVSSKRRWYLRCDGNYKNGYGEVIGTVTIDKINAHGRVVLHE